MTKRKPSESGQNVEVGRLSSGCVYFLFLVALAIGISFAAMNQLALEEDVTVKKPDFFPGFIPNSVDLPPIAIQVGIGLVSFFLLYVFIALILGFLGVGKQDHLDERGWWKREE